MLIRDNKISGQNDSTDSIDKYIAHAILGKDKSMFHYLDKLALKGIFSVSYGATVLINRAVEYYQKNTEEIDQKHVEDYKYYVLNYSVQFIWNIFMIMTCSFEEQVEESLSLVSNILYRNRQAVKLMTRMFQKPLFYKVDDADELFKQSSWSRWEWKQFFTKLSGNYNTATEQWNSKTRNELYDCILKEVDNYISVHKEFEHSRTNSARKSLSFSQNKYPHISSGAKYLRWNNDEFEVDYPSLRNLCQVGKYYLAILLNEKPIVPYMIEVITDPIKFWGQLGIRYHCTQSVEEKVLMIKVMINMYQKHYQMIKQMMCLPYWVKLLTKESHPHIHFWVLQLIYNALNVPFEDYAK